MAMNWDAIVDKIGAAFEEQDTSNILLKSINLPDGTTQTQRDLRDIFSVLNIARNQQATEDRDVNGIISKAEIDNFHDDVETRPRGGCC